MLRPAHAAHPDDHVVGDAFRVDEVVLTAVLDHATVSIVPLEPPPLNWIVNESPEFSVNADP